MPFVVFPFSLFLRLPSFDHVDLWLLLWVVGISDFVIKFGAIVLKALVALIPKPALAHKKRVRLCNMCNYFFSKLLITQPSETVATQFLPHPPLGGTGMQATVRGPPPPHLWPLSCVHITMEMTSRHSMTGLS